MTVVKYLDSDTSADFAQWLAHWQAWPGREVFAHPAYVRLFARPTDKVMCATMTVGNGGVLFPFILRPVAAEPWAESGERAWDIVTPYGYGGAFAWNVSDADAEAFWRQFHVWAVSRGVISLFARLSLFAEQQLPFAGEVVVDRPNVVRSLTPAPDELWRGYEHKVRKNVNCAKRCNLTSEIDLNGERLDEFLAIYHSTMDRRDADNGYKFSREFFEAIVRELAGQFIFCHVFDGRRMVSTELVLVSTDNIYSFLGGTLADAFPKRPNDLLKHDVILWARSAGKRSFVLGGGYEGQDGIYHYKKAFAPDGSRPFCVGRRIHDADNYARLIERRRQWEMSQGNAWMPGPSYFPAYRAAAERVRNPVPIRAA